MRLTKYNSETGEYEYTTKAKTQEEFIAQRKAVIQKLGEYEDKVDKGKWKDGKLPWCEFCGQPHSLETEDTYYESLYETIRTIVKYNGHSEWLKQLITELEEKKKEGSYTNYPLPLLMRELHTEKHTIFEILTGMFGDWGTSIRFGWIEQYDACIEFIKSILPEEEEEQ